MFENIIRMFSFDGPDPEDESEDQRDLEQLAESSYGVDDGLEQDVDDGPDVAELDVRLDELDDELDSTESSLRALRSSQDEMAESIEEVNDTVRQLVGVYDRLAAEENPFIDEPEETADDTASPMPEVDGEEITSSATDDTVPSDRGAERESATDETSDDSTVVSFDDLQGQANGEWSEGDRYPADASTEDELSTDSGTNQVAAEDRDWVPASTQMAEADTTPVLVSIPDGYAGDVLVMEWLATLMDRSGPAGALRAIDHYESVGWISPEVKDRLIDVIGGPALDVFVDPTQPREPTADEHAVSHEYLRVLNRLTEI